MIAYRILVTVNNEWLDKEFAQELFLVRTTSEAITSSVFVFQLCYYKVCSYSDDCCMILIMTISVLC